MVLKCLNNDPISSTLFVRAAGGRLPIHAFPKSNPCAITSSFQTNAINSTHKWFIGSIICSTWGDSAPYSG